MLVKVVGSSNVTLGPDLVFSHQRPTYLDPHGVPSGGDWALERMAALFLNNTVSSKVIGSVFVKLGGNAVILSGRNRFVEIVGNEFAWLGGSGVLLWGITEGLDGRGLTQPRHSLIQGNLFREVGHWQKQSSFVMSARSCLTTILGNVMLNGPRAGVNINDGFGGGNIIERNLIINTCRESGDHGPFNSWDRLPFIADPLEKGSDSMVPLFNKIHQNFLMANYFRDGG
mmetsp:Transcript_46924/g.73445  ORF Transcript_46924/g.73445 Transcript_46924/m.73445 type:complete len:228 (+) Transcript_46924:430-1113(+)